jgi:hypothetical protein
MIKVDVDRKILDKVSKRVKERMDSLEKLVDPRFEGHGMGIEGWFRVEAIAALHPDVDFQYRKPDLKIVIAGETRYIELKAHNMPNWLLAKNGIKYYEKREIHVDGCLFLARMPENPDEERKKLENTRFELLPRKISRSRSKWFVGLLKQKKTQ